MSQHEKLSTPSFFDEETLAALHPENTYELSGGISEVLPARKGPLDIHVDVAQTELVLGKLLEALQMNKPPYNQERVRVAQDARHMPENLERGTVDHAMFFFNSCYYMRGAIKSNDAVRWVARVYDNRPDLFNCDIASEVDPSEIEAVLSAHGLSYDKHTVANHWIENSKRLREKYDGDPRNIFKGVSSYEHSLERIRNDHKGNGFKGYQAKMTSMLTYYLIAEELIDQSYNFPVPIDFHAMRVSIANEMITFPNSPNGTNFYTEQTAETLRNLYADYAYRHNVSPLALCDAVWLLSESTCSRAPGNKTQRVKIKDPDGADKSLFVPAIVSLDSMPDKIAYRSSCGICPLEDLCRHNIPSAPYYNGGDLIIRGERKRFRLPEAVVQLSILE